MGKYKIIALIGEAGSGKDYIMKQVLAAAPDMFNEIISCTTRPMREGEQEGVNYYYLTKEQFAEKLYNNEMLESTIFNDWYYGTSIDSLSKDKPNIGVFNPAGIYSLKDRPDIDLVVYRICCSSKTRLLRQLHRENDPDVDEIIRRFMTDTKDFADLGFSYTKLPNELNLDAPLAVNQILLHGIGATEQGQKWINNLS